MAAFRKLNPLYWVVCSTEQSRSLFERMFPSYVARSRDGGLLAGSAFTALMLCLPVIVIVDTICVIVGEVTVTGFFVTFALALGCSLTGVAVGCLILHAIWQRLDY